MGAMMSYVIEDASHTVRLHNTEALWAFAQHASHQVQLKMLGIIEENVCMSLCHSIWHLYYKLLYLQCLHTRAFFYPRRFSIFDMKQSHFQSLRRACDRFKTAMFFPYRSISSLESLHQMFGWGLSGDGSYYRVQQGAAEQSEQPPEAAGRARDRWQPTADTVGQPNILRDFNTSDFSCLYYWICPIVHSECTYTPLYPDYFSLFLFHCSTLFT